MPRVLRTLLPRIRASIAHRGVMATLRRSPMLPLNLAREYAAARKLRPGGPRSEFDTAHDVDTDGEIDGWTYLSDLAIPSPNWIYGVNYCAIAPDRFAAVFASVAIEHERYTFIDFGSGKGRALLMASAFPFRRIIGIEFAPELHAVAQRNIGGYRRGPDGCGSVVSVCADFLDFILPPEPLALFFYDPCADVLFPRVLARVRDSLREHPRPLALIYVAPGNKEAMLDAADFLVKEGADARWQFCWYSSRAPL